MRWWKTVLAQMSKEEVYHKPLNIPVSNTVKTIMEDLAGRGKRALIVGGAVRDALLGISPKDVDIEVYGTTYPELAEILSSYKGKVDFVGKAFGIIKFTDAEGNQYDFSLPRRESKKAGGRHTDFDIIPDPTMTPKDAANRRDFTWNALAFDPVTEEIHDYFGGVQDLENKVLRHTSGAFSEDPLRVLRGMQFVSRMGFDIAPETAQLAQELASSFGDSLSPEEHGDDTPWLAKERIAEEFMKMATKGRYPSKMLKYLRDTGWDRFFPEIANLYNKSNDVRRQLKEQGYTDAQIDGMDGIPQEFKWHPEGEVHKHIGHTMDAAAAIADREGLKGDDRAVLLLSALAHDFAKPETTFYREGKGWTSYGHEQKGGPLARNFLESIGIKPEIINQVVALVENHMKHISIGSNPSDKAINNLANRLHLSKASIEKLVRLIEADNSGRPDIQNYPDIDVYNLVKNKQMLAPNEAQKINNFYEQAKKRGVHQGPLQPLLRGQDILNIDPSMKPGPEFGQILKRAYILQVEGKLKTREEALEWLANSFSKKKQFMLQ